MDEGNMELDLTRLNSKEAVLEDMHRMNGFGTRLTGSKGQQNFVAFFKLEAAVSFYGESHLQSGTLLHHRPGFPHLR